MIDTTPCVPESTRVTVLKGGESAEREVSLVSGAACAAALREEGFPVVEIDTKDADAIAQIVASKPDVVFIALHGAGGEDGCMQGVCETLHLPYTASGVLASALAMDKTRAKIIYQGAGLPTPPSVSLERGDEYSVEEIYATMGGKCVVKPARAGSSAGVSIVATEAALQAALDTAFSEDSDLVLVEKFVAGTEVTCAAVGNHTVEALPVIEIVPADAYEFYDFEAKYAAGGATHIIPARISEAATATIQANAIAAHKALGCRGASRTDFIIDEAGTCWTIETNTIPGMTPTSLLPDAAAKVGIEFGPLCRKLVELALS